MIGRYTSSQKITDGSIVARRKYISAGYDTHWHEFYEIELVVSGDGSYVIDGVCYPIKPGMLYFMSPVNFHSVQTCNTDIYNIMFMGDTCNKEILYKLSSSRRSDCISLGGNNLQLITSLIDEMITSTKNKDYTYTSALLNCLLCKMCNLSECDSSRALTKIQKTLLYVQNNFRSGITLEDVATQANVTPAYMSRIFKEKCGMNFKQYLDNIRYDYASKLLEHSDMSVTDICFESGFNDYSNFARSFKQRFGTSPGQYREKHDEM
ncbi:MAG: helix-turn-helix domain-containing protein [Clostridia bacterium]|nr:helix-turn-helix domain-containing protein [Clostridia bacterium]